MDGRLTPLGYRIKVYDREKEIRNQPLNRVFIGIREIRRYP